MSKSKPKPFSGYDWMKATCIDGGNSGVRFDYHVTGAAVNGRDGHDEDVSQWTDRDIRKLACGTLDVKESDAERIEVIWD